MIGILWVDFFNVSLQYPRNFDHPCYDCAVRINPESGSINRFRI